MADELKVTHLEAHKKFAVELFNLAWGLYDKKGRTQDEDDAMIFAANASAYHWMMLKDEIDNDRWLKSTPRSHNQLANVYISLNRSEPAKYHGHRCVDLCKERNIGDFDLAFGFECLARAYDIAGDVVKRDEYTALALEASNDIEKPEDKEYFLSELEKISGYQGGADG